MIDLRSGVDREGLLCSVVQFFLAHEASLRDRRKQMASYPVLLCFQAILVWCAVVTSSLEDDR